jgi:hypothetical protein
MTEALSYRVKCTNLDDEVIKQVCQYMYFLSDCVQSCSYVDDEFDVSISRVSVELGPEQIEAEILAAVERFRSVRAKRFSSVLCRKVSLEQTFTNNGEFTNALLDSGALKRNLSGDFSYSGPLASFIFNLDSMLQAEFTKIGAVNELYSPFVSIDAIVKLGYLKSFPHHALFVAPARRGKEVYKELVEELNDTNTGILDSRYTGSSDRIAAPTVCYRCFELLGGKILGGGSTYTAVCHCFRNEGQFGSGLDRLSAFYMREVIFIGSHEYCGGIKIRSQKILLDMFNRLQLPYTIEVASDPFFIDPSINRTRYQLLASTKLEVRIPVSADGKSVSVVSINNHEATLVKAVDITVRGVEEGDLMSGCIGLGYDRLVLAMAAHHGGNVNDWPNT